MITRYGYNVVSTVAIIAFILIACSFLINSNIVKWILIILPALFMVFTLYFFRDPNRIVPNENKIVISPADGKVINIQEIEERSFFNSKTIKISIFMSPLNVHVNRIPISGVVEYLHYHKGEFSPAFVDKASDKNERMEIGINSDLGKIKFVQIAGTIARRIVCNLSQNQKVDIGDRFGMIKFGSRVDVYLPTNVKINVKLDDNVSAGETIIARFD